MSNGENASIRAQHLRDRGSARRLQCISDRFIFCWYVRSFERSMREFLRIRGFLIWDAAREWRAVRGRLKARRTQTWSDSIGMGGLFRNAAGRTSSLEFLEP